MKSILSIILSLCLTAMSVQAQSTNAPGPGPDSVIVVAFWIAVTSAGLIATIWVCSKYSNNTPVTLVLQKSTDGGGTWTPVYTNTVVLNGTKPIEFFKDRMTDDLAFYRAVRQ